MTQISNHTKQLHIQKWKESGLPLSTYSEQAGIPSSTMRGWLKKVKAYADPAPHFIELSNSSVPHQTDHESSLKSQHVELAFPSGLILKIYG